MSQKKRYKVLAILPRADGTGTYFTKIGDGFENKDASINMHLSLVPLVSGANRGITIQLRELDDQDQRRIESYRSNRPPPTIGGAAAERRAQDDLPL